MILIIFYKVYCMKKLCVSAIILLSFVPIVGMWSSEVRPSVTLGSLPTHSLHFFIQRNNNDNSLVASSLDSDGSDSENDDECFYEACDSSGYDDKEADDKEKAQKFSLLPLFLCTDKVMSNQEKSNELSPNELYAAGLTPTVSRQSWQRTPNNPVARRLFQD